MHYDLSESVSHSVVSTLVTPRTVAFQVPLSLEFSRQETGVGCHFLLQGIFQTKDWTQVSHIAGRFFTIWATREFLWFNMDIILRKGYVLQKGISFM